MDMHQSLTLEFLSPADVEDLKGIYQVLSLNASFPVRGRVKLLLVYHLENVNSLVTLRTVPYPICLTLMDNMHMEVGCFILQKAVIKIMCHED